MKQPTAGYRAAVIGSSSLMGREILAVLGERHFPAGQLLKFEGGSDDAEAVGLKAGGDSLSSLDFIFIASQTAQALRFLQGGKGPRPNGGDRPAVIDLTGAEGVVSIPFLNEAGTIPRAGKHFVAPHAAVIVLSALLSRFAARFPIERSVATIFAGASESGSAAIEELHKQTTNVLSFQKLPKEVFGAQMAFNLLPRLGGAAKSGAEGLEPRIRSELYRYWGGKAQLPAFRLIYVPAFYSLAISLFLETPSPVSPADAEQALMGEPIRFLRPEDDAPTLVGAAGSRQILADPPTSDPAWPEGIWIWAVADNLRLAAENAVTIAEKLGETRKP
jgi:aspartate-semialdehyde dehydrogenase